MPGAGWSRLQGKLDQDDGEEAGKQQEEALADLEDAQEELEQARREAEEQLAVEQLARMGDRLKSLAERQEKIVSETASYESLRQKAQGRFTVAQRAGVKGLGQVQAGLKEETADLTENLDGAPVFALTLRRASDSMQQAADQLLELKTGKSTEDAARAASDRFKQLLESLKADAWRWPARRRWWWRRWRWRRRWRRRGQRRRHPGDRSAQDAQVSPERNQRSDRDV